MKKIRKLLTSSALLINILGASFVIHTNANAAEALHECNDAS